MSEFVQDRAGRVGEERLVAALRYASKRLGGWWTYDPTNEEPDLRLLLHEAADEVLRLRELIGQAAAEANNGELNQPGRRQEDDVNLVPVEPQTFDWQMGGSWSESGPSRSWIHDKPGRARSLVKNKTLAVWEPQTIGVRRLTPTECERLQGFPDDWTQLGDTPDSRRYSALGDAVTVNVAEWIGGRLAA